MMIYVLTCDMCADWEDYDYDDVMSDMIGVFSSKEEAYKHFPIDKCSVEQHENDYESWIANKELIREFNNTGDDPKGPWYGIDEDNGFIKFRIEQVELDKVMNEWYN